MAHLIDTLSKVMMVEAQQDLQQAHDFLVRCAQAHHESAGETATWGIKTKRLPVSLDVPGHPRPKLVTKLSERMGELVNIVATLERLLDALKWFASQPEFASLMVLECHPSTSSGGNDLVLGTQDRPTVLCEVSDVVGKSDGNKKGDRDIETLRKSKGTGSSRCFLCTSAEVAPSIVNRSRVATGCTVETRKGGSGDETVLLEVAWL